ncbi:hypothetical protein MKX01_008966 [Papaver californicum]|nr:hypothetical protein MKX01_008966 [Papaver californicum]
MESMKQSQGDLGSEMDGVCCGLCMEPCCLPCGHVYGLACIKKWIQQCRRGPSKCPQCGSKCTVKNIIKLYVSRLVVTDGAQEQVRIVIHITRCCPQGVSLINIPFFFFQKLHSLKAENDFLKMQMADLKEKIKQDMEAWLIKERVKRQCVENVSLGDSGIRSVRCNSEPRLNGRNHGLNPAAGQGYPPCRFKLLDELTVDGGRVFDMDFSHDVLLLAQRQHAIDGEHVLTKISLLHPYESERIKLPPGSKFVKDLHISPSGKLALCASLGKKASILSMERNNFVIKYELPVNNSPLHNGGRSVLTASSIGPCVWKTGVCISLAYSPITDDIVVSFSPRVQTPYDVVATQSNGFSCSYHHNMGSMLVCVNNIRLQKSVILNLENRNPLFVKKLYPTYRIRTSDLRINCYNYSPPLYQLS